MIQQKCNRRRGAALYVTVVTTSLIVSLLGLAGLTVLRIERIQMDSNGDRRTARTNANSAVELSLETLANDSNWRKTYASGVETTAQSLGAGGRGTLSWMLKDSDGLLTDDDVDLRLYGIGRIGSVVQVSSVQITQPKTGGGSNIVLNPGFESATDKWAGMTCHIANDPKGDHRSGASCLAVFGLSLPTSGPYQIVTPYIANDATYDIEFWVKMVSGTSEFIIDLETTASGSGTQHFTSATVVVDDTWTRVSATLTPTWSGALTSANLKISNIRSFDAFKVDDVSLVEQGRPANPEIVPGTWQWDQL